jgi:hypothetical protein
VSPSLGFTCILNRTGKLQYLYDFTGKSKVICSEGYIRITWNKKSSKKMGCRDPTFYKAF